MALRCPYCQHGLTFKDAKPGRYSPKCPNCSQKFSLTIPAEPGAEPLVKALPAAAPDATMPPTGATATPATTVHAKAAPPAASTTVGKPAAPKPAATTKPPAGADLATGVWDARGAAGTVANPQRSAPTAPPVKKSPGPWSNSPPADPNATGAFLPNSGGDPNATGAFIPVTTGGNATGAWNNTQASGADATNAPRGDATVAARGQGATVAGGIPPGSLPDGTPGQLGGYKIVKELGRGGMGSVYLARQLSLDRNVALKVMQPQWARDPTFVARFTREAYAAAQLVHHNVVQIYDIGSDRDTNYFSMEFVDGQSISDLVKHEGKLDAEVAVGYILQAARGLKFAHDQGMIHRDIKPDNLMLNKLGVVKVADLGLVKTPASAAAEEGRPLAAAAKAEILSRLGTDVTNANVAMGTPAYMSPEQGEDAAHVDHRADIYSLGCSLYVMVTGKPPYEGRTAFEVITKHKTEPMVRPELIVSRVPKELGDIIMKMTSKKADDRYANLDEVIKALERFLGVQSSGPFSPKEEHVQSLEESLKAFNAAPAARLKPKLVGAFLGLCVLLFLILAVFKLSLAIGVVGMVAMTGAIYFVVSGVKERTYLFGKVRELVLGSSWTDWATWAMGALLFLTALYVLNWVVIWGAFGIAAAGIACAFYFMFDRQIVAQRTEPIEKTEALLKSLRIKGLDEDAIRQFVCKYGGDRWEEFFEALFGYEAKLSAREWSRGERGRAREKFRAWRDPLISWIDGKQRARREAKEEKHLRKIEEKGLQAQGMTVAEARQRAERTAQAMVGQAAGIRETVVATAPGQAIDPNKKRAMIRAMLEAAQNAEPAPKKSGLAALAGPLGLVFGARARFLLGGLLLAGCLLWVRQNGETFNPERIQDLKAAAIQQIDKSQDEGGQLDEVKKTVAKLAGQGKPTRPLSVPFIPESLAKSLFNTINPGLAGLILILSAFFRGMKIAVFAYPAAAIALVGHWFQIPTWPGNIVYGLQGVIGLGIMAAGFFLGRSRG